MVGTFGMATDSVTRVYGVSQSVFHMVVRVVVENKVIGRGIVVTMELAVRLARC